MSAVANGDLDAFEQIVLRHQTSAWEVAYHFTGDATEAEDIAQEAFLRILDSAHRYRPSARFATYLHRVVTRLCLDHAKKKRPDYTDDLRATRGDDPPPLAVLASQERQEAVRQALTRLPARPRLAVILRHYQSLSSVEAAEVMGASVKAVERLLARARSALATHLKEFVEE